MSYDTDMRRRGFFCALALACGLSALAQAAALVTGHSISPVPPSGIVSLGIMKPANSDLPEREITVKLPPNYDPSKALSVLVHLDGQNWRRNELSWNLDSAVETHVRNGHEPFLSILVPNAGERRSDEYLPESAFDVVHGRGKAGGQLEEFYSFLVHQVRPAVDARFLTKPGAMGIIGSSYGAVAAFCIGMKHPDKVDRIIAHSLSAGWNEKRLIKLVENSKIKPPITLWTDIGTNEEDTPEKSFQVLLMFREFKAALQKLGFLEGKDMRTLEDNSPEGSHHDENAWAQPQRLPASLQFLFP